MKLKGADQSGIALLLDIFHCLGTPTEDVWPGCTQLAHWSDDFPKWDAGVLLRNRVSKTLGEHGWSLISGCLEYDPRKRLSARGAVLHPLFAHDGLQMVRLPYDQFRLSRHGGSSACMRIIADAANLFVQSPTFLVNPVEDIRTLIKQAVLDYADGDGAYLRTLLRPGQWAVDEGCGIEGPTALVKLVKLINEAGKRNRGMVVRPIGPDEAGN